MSTDLGIVSIEEGLFRKSVFILGGTGICLIGLPLQTKKVKDEGRVNSVNLLCAQVNMFKAGKAGKRMSWFLQQ
jgi:hypothetical protein